MINTGEESHLCAKTHMILDYMRSIAQTAQLASSNVMLLGGAKNVRAVVVIVLLMLQAHAVATRESVQNESRRSIPQLISDIVGGAAVRPATSLLKRGWFFSSVGTLEL